MCYVCYVYLQHIRVVFIVRKSYYKKPIAIGNANAVKPVQYAVRLPTL